ncbi:MAG TPA: LTA synthase family protein [bacterium]|nr:LTA synthase family protein [bacterium]
MNSYADIGQLFWIGGKNDIINIAYLTGIPTLLLLVRMFWGVSLTRTERFFRICVYVTVCYISAVVIADWGYYGYFGSRLNASLFNLMSSSDVVFSMLYSQYALLVVIWILLSYLFVRLMQFGFNRYSVVIASKPRLNRASILIALMIVGLWFQASRGFAWHRKFREGSATAFFSNNVFLNTAAINPVNGFTKDAWRMAFRGSKKINWMSEQEAFTVLHRYYPESGSSSTRLLAHEIRGIKPASDQNIVIVLMESMASKFVGALGNKENLTPHLDSIAAQGLLFNNFYSSGIHTYNGVHSTLFGLPAIFKQHPMNTTQALQEHAGLSHMLKERGYRTVFFSPHQATFDNIGGFLGMNAFDRVYDPSDYRDAETANLWGVDDRSLFQSAGKVLDTLADHSPFFSVILTVSNHGPYAIPDDFSPYPGEKDRSHAVRFADQSIGSFMASVKKSKWFDRTIFVFLGDHGARGVNTYDMDLEYLHIPFIIWSKGLPPSIISDLGGQIDIPATIMGLIGGDYTNNTFGIDLLRERREFLPINSDTKVGCLSKSFLLSLTPKNKPVVSRLSMDIAVPDSQAVVARMSEYLKSIMQSAQWLIDHRQLSLSKK